MIFCQTKAQAKQHMMDIRIELEGNDLLKKDLRPFQEESDKCGSHSLISTACKEFITTLITASG